MYFLCTKIGNIFRKDMTEMLPLFPIINSQKGVPEYYGLRLYPLNLIRVIPAKGFYNRCAPFCYNFKHK